MKHSTCTSYDELPLMLSVAEVAAVLGISRAGAYELVHGNEFPALKNRQPDRCSKRISFSHGRREQRFKKHTAVNLLKSQAPIERKFAGGKRAIAKQRRQNGLFGRLKQSIGDLSSFYCGKLR